MPVTRLSQRFRVLPRYARTTIRAVPAQDSSMVGILHAAIINSLLVVHVLISGAALKKSSNARQTARVRRTAEILRAAREDVRAREQARREGFRTAHCTSAVSPKSTAFTCFVHGARDRRDLISFAGQPDSFRRHRPTSSSSPHCNLLMLTTI